MKEVLENHRRDFLYMDQYNVFRITIWSSIWDVAVRAMKRSFDEKKTCQYCFSWRECSR